MKISVIGAGGWGTALAIQAAQNNEVLLWAFSEEEARPLLTKKENPDYLPGIKIPGSVEISTDEKKASGADMLVFVVPSKYLRSVALRFQPHIKPSHIIVSAAKGLEFPSEKRMSEVLSEVFPHNGIVVISGPSHAEEVARGVPTSIVAASKNTNFAETVQKAFSTETLRLYRNQDIIGVEIAAAVKNVIAIAAGILRGLGFGDNTMAALITRGLAEIRRLGLKLGAKEETFAGLAGLGDLIVTCISRYSRNGRVGEELAKGKKIGDIVSSMRMVAEGVETVKTLVQMEHDFNIEMPISHAVHDIIEERLSPLEALKKLMARPLKDEFI